MTSWPNQVELIALRRVASFSKARSLFSESARGLRAQIKVANRHPSIRTARRMDHANLGHHQVDTARLLGHVEDFVLHLGSDGGVAFDYHPQSLLLNER